MRSNSIAPGFVTKVNKDGERVIPGSRRPDGTFRKEIRVREGYLPQDEVMKYQSAGNLSIIIFQLKEMMLIIQ